MKFEAVFLLVAEVFRPFFVSLGVGLDESGVYDSCNGRKIFRNNGTQNLKHFRKPKLIYQPLLEFNESRIINPRDTFQVTVATAHQLPIDQPSEHQRFIVSFSSSFVRLKKF